MANHNIEINPQLAAVAGIASAIAFGMMDARFGAFDRPALTALVAGVVAWGIARSDNKAGGGVILIAALVFGVTQLGT